MYNNLVKEMHFDIDRGDWESALSKASRLPKNWSVWQQLPSAHPDGMPNHVIHKVMDLLGHDESNMASFLYELANNLPDHVTPQVLNRAAHLSKDSNYESERFLSHPNWSSDDRYIKLKHAADFWHSYETTVKPGHFAAIKAFFTKKPEKITDHRKQSGHSDEHAHVLPLLQNYAHATQQEILKDDSIVKKYLNGEPHIKVYRGVGGLYGKAIRDKIQYNALTNEIPNKKKIKIPTAHLTSWSTDSGVAGRFAHSRGTIDSQPEDQGVVISKWVPIKSILHSGMHNVIAGQEHPHSSEQEIVIGHPDGHIVVSTDKMKFQRPHHEFGDTDAAYHLNVKKSENLDLSNTGQLVDLDSNLEKSMKELAARTAMAISMLGISPALEAKDPVKYSANKEISLHQDLLPIRHIESSNGKNYNHPFIQKGIHKGTRAIGNVAIMPLQYKDSIAFDKRLRRKYPEVLEWSLPKDQAKFEQKFKEDPMFELEVANSHWKRIQNNFPNDPDRQVYSWLYGITGATEASLESIQKDDYLQKYKKIKKMLQLQDTPVLIRKSSIDSSDADIGIFTPLNASLNQSSTALAVNNAIAAGQIHDLSNVGKFTHMSFIVGFKPDESWLMKVDEKTRTAIKSAKIGLPSLKEAAFSEFARDIFGLPDVVPQAIAGSIDINKTTRTAVALKMLPQIYKLASDQEHHIPGSMLGILEKYRKSGDLHKMALMLFILGDGDSHNNNTMTDGVNIKLIDHGSGFADFQFDPGTERGVYIPYILRAGRFNISDSKDTKRNKAPRIESADVLQSLKYWIMTLDKNKITDLALKYQILPGPINKRLEAVQSLVASGTRPDILINNLWIDGLNLGDKHGTHAI